ncbi:hypothetical protein CYMTET_18888 [Cymbomonas tetramitiformis]|uniref:RanBP2-type domain-containing protein n=1 Tax=Cymbomonas tetramitiformis TaxID=36881 RepID=A0AAE0G775_9CHLO|nr:hypothetical protein CYMTET_18888 [Cymbomonas tetramitiformis]
MLSVLKKQAENLEKELKSTRLEAQHLRQQQAEHERQLLTRDDRIAELEALLVASRLDTVALSNVSKNEEATTGTETEEPLSINLSVTVDNTPLTSDETEALRKQLEEINKVLKDTSYSLAKEALRRSVLSLEKLLWDDKQQNFNAQLRQLRIQVSDLTDKLQCSRKEVTVLMPFQFKVEDLNLNIELLTKDIERRDEQIAFLMTVHDASTNYEWSQPWNCEMCTLINQSGNKRCEMCDAPKS